MAAKGTYAFSLERRSGSKFLKSVSEIWNGKMLRTVSETGLRETCCKRY